MQITKFQAWDVTSSGNKTIKLVNNTEGSRVVGSLYINPLSDCSVTVTGYVSEDDNTGNELKCVDMVNLEKVDAIEAAGDYLFIVDSFYKVDIEVTGTAKVLIKGLY